MIYRNDFIVSTNEDALRDTMNGLVTGKLIRCRDCKHWKSNGDFPRGQYCTRFQGSGYIWHSRPEDFCSLAEPTLSQQETGLSEERQRGTIK